MLQRAVQQVFLQCKTYHSAPSVFYTSRISAVFENDRAKVKYTNSQSLNKSRITLHQNRKFSANVWHVSNELMKKSESLDSAEKTSQDSPIPSDADLLVPRYLISIAIDPYVNPSNILKLFQLYELTGRSLMKDKIDYPEQFKVLPVAVEQAMKSMSPDELKQLGSYLNTIRNQKMSIITRLITSLCQECSSRLKTACLDEGIKYFETVLGILDKSIRHKSFYPTFTEYFYNQLDNASKEDIIKLMHYCTLDQKTAHTKLVEKCMVKLEQNGLNALSLTSTGILANSVVNSGIRLHPDLSLLPWVDNVLIDKLLSPVYSWTDIEMFSVVAMLNLMRLSRYSNEFLTPAVEAFILKCDSHLLTKQTIPPLIAYLANKCYHEEVFKRIEQHFLYLLHDTEKSVFDLTDYARVMWAFSCARHNCSNEFIERVDQKLLALITLERTQANFLKFVDTLLSMAMMGHMNAKLLKEAFEPLKGRAKSYEGHLLKKLGSRLSMLREAVSVDMPDVQLMPAANYELSASTNNKPSPLLSSLYLQLEQLNSLLDAPLLSIDTPIPSFKTPSICVTDKKLSVVSSEDQISPDDKELLKLLLNQDCKTSIELFEPTNLIRDYNVGMRFTGYINFKCYLMKKLGWKLVLVNSLMIKDESDLKAIIAEQIKSAS